METVQRRRSHRGIPKAYRTKGPTAIWLRVIRKDPCPFCFQPGGSIDHVFPHYRGEDILRQNGFGKDNWRNLVGVCAACNRKKGCMELLEFLIKRRSLMHVPMMEAA